MRRYIITLVVLAVVTGSLFKAARPDQSGSHWMSMWGTIGIVLFGVVGTMAINRYQSRQGLQEIEGALKALEPEWFITDWVYQGKGRPDFLLVGPSGLVAICLEEMPQSTGGNRSRKRVLQGRERVQASVRWLRDRLTQAAPELKAPLADLVRELPVTAVVLLTRHTVEEDYTADGVTVLNPPDLAAYVRAGSAVDLLDKSARIQLTRLFREE